MTTTENVNYTPAAAADIKARYTSVDPLDLSESAHEKRAAIVKELAAKYRGDTSDNAIRSVRSKIVSMKDENGNKIYVPRAAKSTVTGKTPEKKEVMAKNLAAAFGSVEIDGKTRTLSAASLEKMNKPEIDILTFYFNSLIVDESDDEISDENDSQEGEPDTES